MTHITPLDLAIGNWDNTKQLLTTFLFLRSCNLLMKQE